MEKTSQNQGNQRRILIMAGGTGGHVFPALAVAKAIQKKGYQVEWLGTQRGMEADVVPKAGIPLHFIRITGLRREGFVKRILAPIRLLLALFQSLVILHRFKPNVVLGMGGFASGPGGIATWILGIPLVIHEQNAIAGTTNRILARIATRVLEGFPGSFNTDNTNNTDNNSANTVKTGTPINKIKPIKQVIYTGNPVREDFIQIPSPKDRFQDRKGPLNILILGGSQGARALNELCPAAFTRIPKELQPSIKHQTGNAFRESTEHAYREAQISAIVVPFIDNMAEAYAWADLVICRSGALTIAELSMTGLGSILVPFPFAVDDHQTYNGRFLEQGFAAKMISQTVLNPAMLADIIVGLSQNREKIVLMAEAAKGLSKPDALEKVVTHCIEVSL